MAFHPVIGYSANLLPPDPHRDVFRGKELQYAETSLVRYLSQQGGVPLLILEQHSPLALSRAVERVDALLLAGGADVCPVSYGQEEYDTRWPGDYRRDQYELALIEEARKQGKPVLGVCRGLQVLNVYFGGTLHQDNVEYGPTEKVHRDSEVYDHLHHNVTLHEGSELARIYGAGEHRINSIHHQSVRELGEGLTVSATSEDGLVEGIERFDNGWFMGVQWHPEWIDERFTGLLDPAPIVSRFFDAIAGNAR